MFESEPYLELDSEDQADLLTDAPGWMTAGVYGLAGLEAPTSESDGNEA